MQNFNAICDAALLLFVRQGGFIPRSFLYEQKLCSDSETSLVLDRLVSDGYLRSLSPYVPESHQQLASMGYMISGSGYAFVQDGGYTALTKRIFKERQKLQLDTVKLGWEMVISLISLAISIWALIVSSH